MLTWQLGCLRNVHHQALQVYAKPGPDSHTCRKKYPSAETWPDFTCVVLGLLMLEFSRMQPEPM